MGARPCRRPPEHDAAQGADAEREQQHRAVDRQGREVAEVLPVVDRDGVGDPVGAVHRERRADRAGAHEQQHVLDQPLPDEPRLRGAERQSDRHFLTPRAGSRQHHIGDVDAGDQQHAPHHREHHRNDEAHVVVASDFVAEADDPDAAAGVGVGMGG